jgi:uncharacterized membrane protein
VNVERNQTIRLGGVFVAALVGMAFAFAQPDSGILAVIRVLVTLPLVFFLPGFALMELFFPPHMLGLTVRATFSIGMSMAAALLGGFLLHATPDGLTPTNWTVLLGGLTLAFELGAVLRHLLGQREITPTDVTIGDMVSRLNLHQIALFILAGALVVGAVYLARESEANRNLPGFTQMWMLPTSGDPQVAEIGITNQEGNPMKFRLQVRHGGQLIDNRPLIELDDGETWTTTVSLSPARTGPVEAVLYRLDQPGEVYRHVTLK